jgi:hypothetical protein
VTGPTCSVSPGCRTLSCTRCPLTKVPLELPRSSIRRASPSRIRRQCLRDAEIAILAPPHHAHVARDGEAAPPTLTAKHDQDDLHSLAPERSEPYRAEVYLVPDFPASFILCPRHAPVCLNCLMRLSAAAPHNGGPRIRYWTPRYV